MKPGFSFQRRHNGTRRNFRVSLLFICIRISWLDNSSPVYSIILPSWFRMKYFKINKKRPSCCFVLVFLTKSAIEVNSVIWWKHGGNVKCNYHLSCKHFERVLLVFRAREKNGAGELLCQGGHTPVHRSQTFRRAAHLLQGPLGATSGDKPLPVHNSEFSVTF